MTKLTEMAVPLTPTLKQKLLVGVLVYVLGLLHQLSLVKTPQLSQHSEISVLNVWSTKGIF